MENTLFISTQFLKDNSIIEGNIEDRLIINAIIKAQTIDIQNILGQELYTEIKNQVKTKTISTKNKTLLDDYIVPCLVEWAVWRSLPIINTKVKNIALIQQNAENAQPVSNDQEIYLRKDIKQSAEFYSDTLKRYLFKNQSDYPLFLQSQTYEIRQNFRYNTGIYMERKYPYNYTGDRYSELGNQSQAYGEDCF